MGTPRRPERKTRGPEVGLIAASIGKPLMPWQQYVADVALEINPRTGRYAYREIVLTVPRRSGKSTLLLALMVHRMLAMGRSQVAAFTMQNALEARMRMRREWHGEILSRSKALADVYSFTGQAGAEALLFENGSRIEVTASTKSSGHGGTYDLAVVDEAFDQPDDRLEQAFRPATRTQPNAQLWWVSTAGGPSDQWFRGKVETARELCSRPTGTALFEWSAPDDAEASDRSMWWQCMPALGFVRADGSGLTEDDIAEDYEAMRLTNENGFRRAYLNQWREEGMPSAINPDIWHSLVDEDAQQGSSPTYAVATAPDRSWSCIAAAWRRPDGDVQVSVVDYKRTTTWIAERVKALRTSGGKVLLDTASRGLVDGAEEPTTSEQAMAHNALSDAVLAGTVHHDDQGALNTSVRAARWKPMGDTRVLDRKGTADISPLIAASLAAWKVMDAASAPPNIW